MKKFLKLTMLLIIVGISICGQAQNVTQAEYYIDTDPGMGNGISIAIDMEANPSTSLVLATEDLSIGLHYIGIRVKNENDEWGITAVTTIRIQEDFTETPLVAGEYFWDEDPGIGLANQFLISSAQSINEQVHFSTSDLSVGEHLLGIRIKNQSNVWSHYITETVLICEEEPTEADFIYANTALEVYFTDSSHYADSLKWDFGDGNQTQAVNPFHKYDQPGVYTVEQVAFGNCANDTITKELSLIGISNFSPFIATQNSSNILYIDGAFGDVIDVELRHSGTTIKSAIEFTKKSNELVTARFDFENDELGEYELVVIQSNNELFAPSSFLLESDELAFFDPEITFRAPPTFLINKGKIGYVDIVNNGNQTYYGVPVMMKINAPIEPRITGMQQFHDSLPHQVINFQSGKGGFYFVEDSTSYVSEYYISYIVLPQLAPNQKITIPIYYTSEEPTENEFIVSVGEPMYGPDFIRQFNDGELRTSCQFIPPCIDLLLDVVGLVPGASCVVGALSFGCSIGNFVNQAAGSGPVSSNAYYDLLSNTLGALSCGEFYTIQTGQAAANFIFNSAIGAAAAGIGFGGQGDIGSGIPAGVNPDDLNCDVCYFKKKCSAKPGNVKAVGSLDPNEKYGPLGIGAPNYISDRSDKLAYYISFENVDSASAPANQVIIEDVLDRNNYDLNTFSFNSIGFADTVIEINISDTIFGKEIDLRPDKEAILRVDGRLNTTTSKLSFHFKTLDPITKDEVEDVFQGFLNPNVNAPEGEGFVSFTINKKVAIEHLDIISNQASIIFDANQPIITNIWSNVIDDEAPTSAIESLPSIIKDTIIPLKWSGSDNESGIDVYDIYVSINNEAYQLLLSETYLDGIDFVGEYGSSYKFVSMALDKVYNYEVKSNFPDQEVILEIPTSIIIESITIDKLELYPNPAKEKLNLSFNMYKSAEVELIITDQTGREVLKENLNGKKGSIKHQLNIKQWEAGVYFIRLKGAGLSIVESFIKM